MMTGVILAGGKSSRFDNINKSFLKINDKYIIDTQFELFKKLFDEIIIVTNDPVAYLKYDALIVSDLIKNKGPLGGIYTALYYMKGDHSFIAACDMPFLNEKLIRYMIDNVKRDWIYTVKHPRSTSRSISTSLTEKHLDAEPLHSIYSKKCLKTAKNMVLDNKLKISYLFDELKAKAIDIDEVKRLDPDLRSFKNINTEEDLKEVS